MAPFKSAKQARFLLKKKPGLAKEWADKYGVPKNLNERIKKAVKKGGKRG